MYSKSKKNLKKVKKFLKKSSNPFKGCIIKKQFVANWKFHPIDDTIDRSGDIYGVIMRV
jgi:hypothetical protein